MEINALNRTADLTTVEVGYVWYALRSAIERMQGFGFEADAAALTTVLRKLGGPVRREVRDVH